MCSLGLSKGNKNVDNVRYIMYAPKADHDPLDKIKELNQSIMPPCHKVPEYKIKRANFVAAIWKRAASP